MANSNCGCESPDESGEYLLVKATSNQAPTCDPSASGAQSSCSKTEPMFDESLSDFLIPLESSSTSLLVCNGSIYAVGMWLQMVTSGAILKIVAIAGNTLTLVNRCDDGTAIDDNPAVGVVVSKGERFTVSTSAQCGEDVTLEEINNIFSTSTTLCLPALKEASATASCQITGWFNVDSGNPSDCVSIKRVPGFYWSNGSYYMDIAAASIPYSATVKRIGRSEVDGKITRIQNYTEHGNVFPGNQYVLAVTKDNEIPIGPTRFAAFYPTPLQKYDSALGNNSSAGWPVTIGPWDAYYAINVSDAQLNGFSYLNGNYYAMIRLELSAKGTAAGEHIGVITVNNDIKCRLYYDNAVPSTTNVSFPVLIDRSSNSFDVRVTLTGACNFRLVVSIDGVYL